MLIQLCWDYRRELLPFIYVVLGIARRAICLPTEPHLQLLTTPVVVVSDRVLLCSPSWIVAHGHSLASDFQMLEL